MSLLLNVVLFLPAAGACFLLLLPRSPRHAGALRRAALAVSLTVFALSLPLCLRFLPETAEMQFVTDLPWMDSPLIRYHIGVDGISLFLVLLVTFLTVLCVLVSWRSVEQHVREFFFFLLLLETGAIGVFVSMDLFLFYVFWEATLVPMYFLIGVWGHERRIYAATKFFLYTIIGSLPMLVGILWLYQRVGSFDYAAIALAIASGSIRFSPNEELWLFLAFFGAFAIRAPLFPLHTWLPDAHLESPTAGSVMLAGVFLKMGAYGLLRFCLPLFPNASHALAPAIIALAIIGVVYGSLVAMAQPDIKSLIAYSSVAHLGLVVLGIFSFHTLAVEGAVYQMLSHGVSTGALFLLAGMLSDRLHTRRIADMGGLATPAPLLASLFFVTTLASIGLPLLNNFVGQFLILLGVLEENALYAAGGAAGLVLSAAGMLWMYQRVFLGETRPEHAPLPDLDTREKAILIPAVVLMLFMGVASPFFLHRMEASTEALLDQVGRSEIRVQQRDVSPPRSLAAPRSPNRERLVPVSLEWRQRDGFTDAAKPHRD
jgi:NADH-quinone oxidoreductase subunit M